MVPYAFISKAVLTVVVLANLAYQQLEDDYVLTKFEAALLNFTILSQPAAGFALAVAKNVP